MRVVAGPWPERVGCLGTTVQAPPGPPVYPWSKLPRSEVVLLLDDDPLACEKRGCDHGPFRILSCHVKDGTPWTCVMAASDVWPLTPDD